MEMTIEQALKQGVAAHKEGKLQEAERLYRAILQSQPAHPDANHNLGVLAVSVNKAAAALPLFKTALEVNPQMEQFWLSYIDALIKEQQFENAKQVFEQAKKQGVDGDRLISLEAQLSPKTKKPNTAGASPSQELLNSLLGHYQNGRLNAAEKLAVSITNEFPKHQFAWKVLGAVLGQSGRILEGVVAMEKAVKLAPNDSEAHNNLGNTLRELGRLDEAEANYKQAIALKPDYAAPLSNLGVTLQGLGRLDEAEASCRQAIALKPDFAEAHSNLGMILNALGMRENALKHFQISLDLERGSKLLDPKHISFISISKAKIDHDIEQFEYLAGSGYDTTKFNELAAVYRIVASEIDCASDTEVVPLSDKHRGLLGDTYNRPFHILEAPLLDEPTIGKNLNVNKITNDYFSHEFGLTYIDEFLSPKALSSLWDFLLGSTIWFDFSHSNGYIGAYLKDGLSSPLILQIAEDLRLKLPKIFKHHKLTQLWAYKYDSRARDKGSFGGIGAHADFAAINVNFWITPNSANLNKLSGGLVVYNSEAPKEWNFKTYNNDEKRIRKEITKRGGNKIVIPYNENRAVIFNSNLFHETDNIDFKDGYENRRINVTMLFGEREL
ncbi:MAG: hypothetical protein CMQ40_08895 [Gammaproteobacteria bacterium]|nr:hypothetical protein [Gammaproteobacteria bacterium]